VPLFVGLGLLPRLRDKKKRHKKAWQSNFNLAILNSCSLTSLILILPSVFYYLSCDLKINKQFNPIRYVILTLLNII
jgi:small-conductance mechanosensitive channel